VKIGQRVSELQDPEKWHFPIDSVHRPYNSVGTTVPHCDVFVLCALRSITEFILVVHFCVDLIKIII